MATKKRIDFLPAIGQALIAGMRAETLAAIDKGNGHPSYCLQELFRLANVPLDFQRRWSEERAIQDVLIKARDYGFVDKSCNGHWRYSGPEIKVAEKKREARIAKGKKKVDAHLKRLGMKVERNSLRVEKYGPERGRTSVRAILPKSLWVK